MPVIPSARVQVKDEGAVVGRYGTLDFRGSGVSATEVGGEGRITITAGAGVFAITTVEIDIGTQPRRDGQFEITGLSGLTAGNGAFVAQAVGPYTGKGDREDESEMDDVVCNAKVASSTVIRVYWHTRGFVKGNFKFDYATG